MTQPAQSFTPEERRKYLGASEIAAVLGFDQYRSPLDVFNSKLGLSEPFEGNRHTERGNRLERVAAEIFTEIDGRKLRRKTAAYTHPVYPYIVGHVDRIVEGQRTIAEIKCPSLGAFRKFQREGLPERFVIQMQVYLGLSGYTEGVWIIFCADQMDCAAFDITFDPTIYEQAIAGAVKFWTEFVLKGVAPDVGIEKTALDIATPVGSLIRRDDPTWAEAVQLLREADRIKKDGEELFEMAKGKVLDAIENEGGVYEGAGLRLYFTEQAGRTTFDKKGLAATHPEIDLSKFEKQGKPFKTFRPFWLGSQE